MDFEVVTPKVKKVRLFLTVQEVLLISGVLDGVANGEDDQLYCDHANDHYGADTNTGELCNLSTDLDSVCRVIR